MQSAGSVDEIQPASVPVEESMVWVDGGAFLMGSDNHYAEEAPAHRTTIQGFWIDPYPTTNQQFERFVEATGHVTLAERPPREEDYPGALPEMLQPASVVFVKPSHRVDLRDHFSWWAYIPRADWRHPEGPDSSLRNRADHPVVHLAYEDVEAYAKWAGKEIPTEAEWEFAARGGLEAASYQWGEEFAPEGKQMANTWQGEFPWQNLLTDGFERTSPVGHFPANGYGLYDMIGNVWEWTSDWYSPRHQVKDGCCGGIKPKGDRENSFDPRQPAIRIPRKVMKGGSFLCAPNYCQRYRPAARMAQPVDTSTCHLGMRLIRRLDSAVASGS